MGGNLNSFLRRRIAGLEQRLPRRKSLAEFVSEAGNVATLTGTSLEVAMRTMIADVTEECLQRWIVEARALRQATTRRKSSR